MSEVENKGFETCEVGGQTYRLKLIPALKALGIINKLEKHGFSPEVVLEVISSGAAIGGMDFTEKKFNTHFAGKLQDAMSLFAEVLKYNKMFPEAEEGNGEDSED